MKTRLSLISSLLFLALFATACGSQRAAAASPEPVPTTATSSREGSVQDQASLIDALEAAGATVETGDSLEQAFFSVTGQILKVNGVDVQVFEYESAEAMEADAVQVSADGGSIGTSMVMWVEAPHFYKAGRILVLYVGEDQDILDLLQEALGSQFAGR